MERQLERLERYPQARALLHETETQRARLERLLGRHGSSPSTFKDMAQSLLGNLASMTNAMAGDEILKNTFTNFAFEHFEIAAYRSLIAMAAQVDPVAVPELELTLRKEEAMARQIGDSIAIITLDYTMRESTGQRAAS